MKRGIRVLVADDETNLRELIVRELGRRGLEAEGVGDGEAALARLREDPHDVVVLDMKMPKKEGIEVLRELQDFPEHPQVIVPAGQWQSADPAPDGEHRYTLISCIVAPAFEFKGFELAPPGWAPKD